MNADPDSAGFWPVEIWQEPETRSRKVVLPTMILSSTAFLMVPRPTAALSSMAPQWSWDTMTPWTLTLTLDGGGSQEGWDPLCYVISLGLC